MFLLENKSQIIANMFEGGGGMNINFIYQGRYFR